MATGTYGVVRGADVSQEDIEVFYTYAASRDKQSTGLVKITNTTDVLIKVDNPNKAQSNITSFEMFGGMYTLKLPASIFAS